MVSWISNNKKYLLGLGAVFLVIAVVFFAKAVVQATPEKAVVQATPEKFNEGIIYVYSDSCGYCTEFSPSFEQAVSSYPDLQVESWNINKDQVKMDKAIEMGAEVTPTVFFIKEGKVIDKIEGSVSEQAVHKFINKNM
ncbi:thioredoxin family protein [Brevibacillus sp. 179-C9.3 HS]|uniref:thioredoxin family protein n=1 Tax=unclassified Brevibacillus TaxID=2684853 RepID=UPI00399FBEB4